MQIIKDFIAEQLPQQNFDSIAVGVVDFRTGKTASFEFYEGIESSHQHYFDIASLTKPFTLALSFLKQADLFSSEMQLLLNHRGGLPSYGRLSKKHWREFLKKFNVHESEVLYSDYSALRLMIEIEEKIGKPLYEFVKDDWHSEVCFHKDLVKPTESPCCGMREGKEIRGVVHDPNAYTLDCFCSHAGLFATINGVLQTLLKFETNYNLIDVMKEALQRQPRYRFVNGFDTVTDPTNTLAGSYHSINTFGHLGFTGTSFWIDVEKQKGHCMLSNATQNFWFQRQGLQALRRELGSRLISFDF